MLRTGRQWRRAAPCNAAPRRGTVDVSVLDTENDFHSQSHRQKHFVPHQRRVSPCTSGTRNRIASALPGATGTLPRTLRANVPAGLPAREYSNIETRLKRFASYRHATKPPPRTPAVTFQHDTRQQSCIFYRNGCISTIPMQYTIKSTTQVDYYFSQHHFHGSLYCATQPSNTFAFATPQYGATIILLRST